MSQDKGAGGGGRSGRSAPGRRDKFTVNHALYERRQGLYERKIQRINSEIRNLEAGVDKARDVRGRAVGRMGVQGQRGVADGRDLNRVAPKSSATIAANRARIKELNRLYDTIVSARMKRNSFSQVEQDAYFRKRNS